MTSWPDSMYVCNTVLRPYVTEIIISITFLINSITKDLLYLALEYLTTQKFRFFFYKKKKQIISSKQLLMVYEILRFLTQCHKKVLGVPY